MVINKIIVKNYRNYKETEVNFNNDVNIIVGANNSGKTNILNILSLLSTDTKLSINDFNKNILFKDYNNFKEKPPVIEIEYYIKHIMSYEKFDSGFSRLDKFILYNDDGNLSSENNNNFLINAKVILKYELDSQYVGEYNTEMKKINSYDEFIRCLKKFEYNYKINFYNNQNEFIIKSKVKNIFHIEKVNANRAVSDITENTKKYVKDKINDEKVQINELSNNINLEMKKELSVISKTINEEIKKDQHEIGVSNGKNDFISTFEFNSDFTDFFKYELQNDNIGYTLPLDNNGLGYNNLIYIRNALNFKRENEFNLLLIEEPEAHLHPNMQYKLVQYINHYNNKSPYSNQIFITTHSSNITASAEIDDIIIIDYICNKTEQNVKSINLKNNFNSKYIKEKYKIDIDQNDLESYKKHLCKFLDVTRSDLLFADSVILVEGLSEKIYIPHAFNLIYDNKIENDYISVIEVGGINFKNFLPIFIGTSKKILCISDVDYNYFEKNNFDNKVFESAVKQKLDKMGKKIYNQCENYYFCTQKSGGATFEKELFLENYNDNEKIVKLFFIAFNKEDFKEKIKDDLTRIKSLNFWINNAKQIINDDRIWKSITNIIEKFKRLYENNDNKTNKSEIEKHFLCELFYKYVQRIKGDFALKLCFDNSIKCPNYILEGLEWIKS